MACYVKITESVNQQKMTLVAFSYTIILTPKLRPSCLNSAGMPSRCYVSQNCILLNLHRDQYQPDQHSKVTILVLDSKDNSNKINPRKHGVARPQVFSPFPTDDHVGNGQVNSIRHLT